MARSNERRFFKGRFNVLFSGFSRRRSNSQAKAEEKDVKTPFGFNSQTNRAVNGRGYVPRNAGSLLKQAEII